MLNEKVDEGVQWIGEKITAGVYWVAGIDEIKNIYNPLLGSEPVTLTTSKETGLNLINTALGKYEAMAVGGPIGIISKPNPSLQTQTHESQHIKEQRGQGWVSWVTQYGIDMVSGYIQWGSWEEAYYYHPVEVRARDVAGQTTHGTPTLADWWQWIH